MTKKVRWVQASTALALCIGCGSLPDWSGVQAQLAAGAAGSNANTGGSNSVAGDTSISGNSSIAGSAPMGGSAPIAGSAGVGGAPTGGAGGAGGSSPVAGSGGTAGGGGGGPTQAELDKAELAEALKTLNGFIYQSPCKNGMNGQDVTTLSGCGTSDICWSTPDFGEFSEFRTIPIGGTAGHTYQIDLNVLGVIEPRDYPAYPNCTRLPGQPADTTGIAQCMDGYANKSSVGFNVWEFNIPSPAAKYYMNAVVTHPPHRVDKTDNKFTFKVDAGSTIKFTMDDLNGGEIRNCTNTMTSSQFMRADGSTVTASATVQQPYNGQWMQLSVLNATIVR